jgi:tetratricopeptide (TPR) repeat protein
MSDGRSYLTCLIGLPPGAREEWTSVLSGRKEPALRGRALSLLGRGDEAVKALDAAIALDAQSAEAWTWRGETHLLAGRREEARRDLDRAVSLSKDWPWARLLRAVCLLTDGDVDAAHKELAALDVPEAALVRALLEGQRGASAAGAASLAPALASAPSGPLFAVRAMLRLGTGDLPGCLEDLNEAAKLEPSAWILMQRADALNRSGFFRPALEDSAAAAKAVPDSPEPHLQAANIYFDQAFYPEALEQMERALAKRPDDAAMLARRARFHLVLGRLPEAEAGLDRACALAPDDSQLRFERLNVIMLLGRYAEVLKAVKAGAVRAPFDSYLTGYVLCRKGDRAGAVKHFLAAAAAADGGFAERCRFYALVCRVLSKPEKKAAARPQFYLCGVGIHHPYQITVEILRALDACEVLYNNLGDPQVSEFLGLFRAEVRAVTRVDNEPAMGRVQRIIAGLKRGRTSGFVTRIHPFIYRRIANDLVTVCEEKKISYKAFGAVSLTEVAWGLGTAELDHGDKRGPFGLRVFDLVHLVNHKGQLEPAHPTIVYAIANDSDRRTFSALVRERYEPERTVYFLAGSGDREQQVVSASVKDLEAKLLSLDLGTVMYLPPSNK